MNIVICGLSGTGKNTAAKELAKILDCKFLSTGHLFSNKAKELGITPKDLEKKCIQNPEYDFEIDTAVAEFGRNNRNFVIEGRLAYWFIPDSWKIKFICDDYVRIKRIASREGLSFEQARCEAAEREQATAERYLNLYGIENLAPDKEFDLVLDTTDIKPDEVVKIIMEYLFPAKTGQKLSSSL